MSSIGYARAGSVGQPIETQERLLEEAGCARIFSEKGGGKERGQLAATLDFVRNGDVLVVTRLDRLGRSPIELLDILVRLAANGVGFRALQQRVVDTTLNGALVLDLLAAFTEFETRLRRERQADGIAKAKAAGVYKGRPRTIDAGRIVALRAEGIGAAEIARRLNICRASVSRALVGAAAPPQKRRKPEVEA
jgi:DNA invertase Pin-like site-specific DNA recombinase